MPVITATIVPAKTETMIKIGAMASTITGYFI